jgi:TolB protein
MRSTDLLAAAFLILLATPTAAQTPVTPAPDPYPLKRLPFLTWVVDYEPFWSPDGKQIVLISNRHGGMKVHVLAADARDHGAGMRQLTFGEAEDDSPAWSPDGKRIVFARQVGETFQIFVMNRDGSGVRQLTDASGRFTNPRWSPDGATILCSRGLGSMTLVTFPAPPGDPDEKAHPR